MSQKRTCIACQKDFLIIDQEQALLEKQGWPLPVECPADRQARRMSMRNPRVLTKSKCDKCGKDIIISFIRKPGDTVYCHEDYRIWLESSNHLVG